MMSWRDNIMKGIEMNREHEGKHYLVIGASSGIGESVTLELASLGANITMLARRTEKMEAILKKMPARNHKYYGFDVTQIDEIFNIVAKIYEEQGKVDGCVYAAGVGDIMRLRDLTYERLHHVMQVNFYPFVEFVRAMISKKLRKDAMHIVAISSMASVSSDRYFTPYSASKAAMDAAVRCLARELVTRNVTINSIRPAVVNVERLRHLDEITEGGLNKQIIDNGYQPLGLIPARDIAKATAYLLSNAANYITGTTMFFNGGAAC